jgi:hypothetical protein
MASNNPLVSGERLLELIFDEVSRPSVRWLHNQKKRRAIPYLKVGRLVRYGNGVLPRLPSRKLNEWWE